MTDREEAAQTVVDIALAHLDADLNRSADQTIRVTKAEIEAYEREPETTQLALSIQGTDIVVRKTRPGRRRTN